MKRRAFKSKPTDQDPKVKPEDLGKMLVSIYESGYLDRNQTYKMSFIKGLLAGFGGVIGATVVVALLIWALSLFSEVPLVGRITQTVVETVQSQPK